MSSNYFLQMIQNLRKNEEIMLYGNILQISDSEAQEVTDFLEKEFQQEALNYPYKAPKFNAESAIWAAKIVYISAQLILYRENKEVELEILLPDYTGEKNVSAILSADLTLRFLPDMLIQLKMIDAQDKLIEVIENKLKIWHYSGINAELEINQLNFDVMESDLCLQQMYVTRIIEFKNLGLAQYPSFKKLIHANLGIFGRNFWKEFN